jgi:hypothetical protein
LRSEIERFVDFLYKAIALRIGQPREMVIAFGPRQRAVILMNHINIVILYRGQFESDGSSGAGELLESAELLSSPAATRRSRMV